MSAASVNLSEDVESPRSVHVYEPGLHRESTGWHIRPLRRGSIGEHEPWSERLLHVLEHIYMHRVLSILLLIDVCAVVADIFIEIRILDLELMQCEHGPMNESQIHQLEEVEEILTLLSVAILSIFLLEHSLLFCALGKNYFRNLFHLIDVATVSASLYLELGLETPEGGLLVLSRVWRFARIAHGIYESSHDEPTRVLRHQVNSYRHRQFIEAAWMTLQFQFGKTPEYDHSLHIDSGIVDEEKVSEIALILAREHPLAIIGMTEILGRFRTAVSAKPQV